MRAHAPFGSAMESSVSEKRPFLNEIVTDVPTLRFNVRKRRRSVSLHITIRATLDFGNLVHPLTASLTSSDWPRAGKPP